MGSFIASMITSGAIGQNIGNYYLIHSLSQNSELFAFETEIQNYLQLKPSEMELKLAKDYSNSFLESRMAN